MATIGLRDFYKAKVTEATDGTETFGIPSKVAKLIGAKLKINAADGTLYGDDGVDVIINEFSNGTLTLDTTDMPDEDYADFVGAKVDPATGIIYSNKSDNPPYFAVGFRAKKPGGKYRYLWLLKVQFKVPDEEFATKGEKIEFKSPTIEGTFVALNKCDDWKADKTLATTDPIAQGWFTKVQEYGADNTALTATTVPVSAATAVSKSAPIVWTFNKKLLQSIVTLDNFSLLKTSDGSKVAASIAYDDTLKTVTLTPSSALSATTQYIAIADNDVCDLAGNHLTAMAVPFTTGA